MARESATKSLRAGLLSRRRGWIDRGSASRPRPRDVGRHTSFILSSSRTDARRGRSRRWWDGRCRGRQHAQNHWRLTGSRVLHQPISLKKFLLFFTVLSVAALVRYSMSASYPPMVPPIASMPTSPTARATLFPVTDLRTLQRQRRSGGGEPTGIGQKQEERNLRCQHAAEQRQRIDAERNEVWR